jgi:hypothetical protein
LHRVDDTPVREALANCLTAADYYGSRGIVVRNDLNEIILENLKHLSRLGTAKLERAASYGDV